MKTICHLQIEPTFHGGRLREIRAQRVTKKMPVSPLPGCVVVKLTLDIPDEAFLPLLAEIEIPIEHARPVLVQSEAESG